MKAAELLDAPDTGGVRQVQGVDHERPDPRRRRADAIEDALTGARAAPRPLLIFDSYERISALGGYSLSRFRSRAQQGAGFALLVSKMLPASLIVQPPQTRAVG